MCLIYWLRLLARFSNYIYGMESSDCRLQVAYGQTLLEQNSGVAMLAMNNILLKWVPVSDRSWSLTLANNRMYLGS
ncbi:hypothetical protein ACP275_05G081100 [Erythranthe tilingii]